MTRKNLKKIAFISDIHGNLEALEEVQKDMEKEQVDTVYCLGDVVGYGPDPLECLERVQAMASLILLGNHDAAVAGLLSTEYFNPHAFTAIHWTRRTLPEEAIKKIHSFPLTFEIPELSALLVHGTPVKPEAFHYLGYDIGIEEAFESYSHRFCFLGHTHIPAIYSFSSEGIRYAYPETLLVEKSRYIVNAGSVGQPRDRDPRASYTIFNLSTNTIQIRRLEYPIHLTQEKMRQVGLPLPLIQRLTWGI